MTEPTVLPRRVGKCHNSGREAGRRTVHTAW